jgi:hypothetical protein
MPISTIGQNGLNAPITLTSPVINTVTSASATALTLQSAGTTAITVDTSQKVGIGTASPTGILNVKGTGGSTFPATSGSTQSAGLVTRLQQGGAIGSVMDIGGNGGGGSWIQVTEASNLATNYSLLLNPNGGVVLANGTSSADSNAKIQAFSPSGNGAQGYIGCFTGGSGGGRANQNVGYMVGQTDLKIYADWDGSGNPRNKINVSAVSSGVQLTSGATSWAAISDERQKDIIEPITNGLTKVASLRTVIGKYKIDADDRRRVFLIAQDVQAVLPEAVVIEDEGQETEKLLLSYTDLIPLLVASIKELKAEVDALKARLTP